MGRFFGWITATPVRIGVAVIAACTVLVGAVVAGVVVYESRSSSDAQRSARAAVEAGVTDACKDAVSDKLRSPGSAQWSSIHASQPVGNILWAVEGVVDSQNGFGALVRGEFLCTIQADNRGNALSVDVDLTMRE